MEQGEMMILNDYPGCFVTVFKVCAKPLGDRSMAAYSLYRGAIVQFRAQE